MILPIGSSLPKYFFAVVSVSTTLPGSFKAVAGLPLSRGKENTVKKLLSDQITFFSLNERLLYTTRSASLGITRTACFISPGKSFDSAMAQGAAVKAEGGFAGS